MFFPGAREQLLLPFFLFTSSVVISNASSAAEGSAQSSRDSVTHKGPHDTNKTSIFDHMHEIIRLSGPVSHIGSPMGIPVGEALDPPLCPPPSMTRSLGICYLKKCSTHHDCERGEACCFNGCIHSCIRPMDRPAAFDWIEDTERILPFLDLDTDEPTTNFVPILLSNKTSQYEEAVGRGELVHLPGGCFISSSRYEDLKEFMQAPSIKACRCNEGEVVCDVHNERL